MKRLLCGLLALLLLAVACPDAGAVSATYSWAFDFHDDVPLRVRLPGGEKQGLVDLVTGKWVITPRFDEVKRFSTMISMGNDYLDDVVAVKVNGKWGIADTEGNLLVAPQYSTVMYEGEGLLSAETDGKRGILDRQGRMLIVPRFDLIDDFADGMARVKEGDRYGYIDNAGRLVIPPQYDHTWGFRDGLAVVRVDGKYGYIDKKGTIVIALVYEQAALFSEGLAAVKVGGKWGYIDKTGTMVIAPQFFEADYFKDGLAVVRPVGKAGVIDREGRMVVEPVFDEMDNSKETPILGIIFNSDYTAGKYIFVDKTGNYITPWFDGAWEFQDGIAKVRVEGKVGFIDTTGKMVIEPQFEDASWHCQNGIVYVMRDGKKGYRDKEGRWLAQPVFGWYSDYLPRHKVVLDKGYIYDGDGNKLDHYANHMKDGYKHLSSQSYPEAAASFRAALRINPGDEAALYGLTLAGEN